MESRGRERRARTKRSVRRSLDQRFDRRSVDHCRDIREISRYRRRRTSYLGGTLRRSLSSSTQRFADLTNLPRDRERSPRARGAKRLTTNDCKTTNNEVVMVSNNREREERRRELSSSRRHQTNRTRFSSHSFTRRLLLNSPRFAEPLRYCDRRS